MRTFLKPIGVAAAMLLTVGLLAPAALADEVEDLQVPLLPCGVDLFTYEQAEDSGWVTESPGEGWDFVEERVAVEGRAATEAQGHWEFEFVHTNNPSHPDSPRWMSDPNWNADSTPQSSGWNWTGVKEFVVTAAAQDAVDEVREYRFERITTSGWLERAPGEGWEQVDGPYVVECELTGEGDGDSSSDTGSDSGDTDGQNTSTPEEPEDTAVLDGEQEQESDQGIVIVDDLDVLDLDLGDESQEDEPQADDSEVLGVQLEQPAPQAVERAAVQASLPRTGAPVILLALLGMLGLGLGGGILTSGTRRES